MSSSSSTRACLQCKDSSSDRYRNGWKLRSGDSALLCHRCASVYEEGRFCETFHSNDDGWRDCDTCGKLVHCGCVVSFNAYMLLDQGGVICMECSKVNFMLARNSRIVLPAPTGVPDLAKRVTIEPHYQPQGTALEIQCIPKAASEYVFDPLFEKQLTATDADFKLGRIVIPKRFAEMFFREVSDPQGTPLNILDTEYKEWDCYFRFWPNGGSKMYVLEGLRDFMISKKLQACDTVTFYRAEPGAKLAMGIKKTSVEKPPH